jgi:putative SOS response-associated peptidase YedK
MCGRFTLRTGSAALAEQFQLADIPDLPPRYNIAPTQEVAVIRHTNGSNTAALLRWGLVPFWARDTAIGAKMINARAETVAEKPAFRAAFQSRRCLIMADGFYEWQAMGSGRRKQPIYLHMRDQCPFAFAGLWETWQGQDGTLQSCTILTTEPNDLVQPIHNRMPVILRPTDYALWLDPDVREPEPLQACLQPYPSDALTAYPVSPYVNNVHHDDPQCVAPAT